jgi:hypothetical protein
MSVEFDAARGGPVETAEHLEKGGFPATRGALDDEPVAVRDGQVDPGERVDRLLAPGIALGDASEFVHGATPG